MKKLFLLFFSVFLVLACDKRNPKEHWFISFTNNADDTVMVFKYYWYGDHQYEDPKESNHNLGGLPRSRYQVAPQMTRTDLFILREASPFVKKETFEKLLESAEDYYYIYVLPNDYDGVSYHSDAKIVSYELTLDDLINLDFHLYFPPNGKMRSIKMYPPYESFIPEE